MSLLICELREILPEQTQAMHQRSNRAAAFVCLHAKKMLWQLLPILDQNRFCKHDLSAACGTVCIATFEKHQCCRDTLQTMSDCANLNGQTWPVVVPLPPTDPVAGAIGPLVPIV